MLKKGRELARAVAESAGIIAPRALGASEAAEQRRQDLVTAQAAVASGEAEVERLYDASASPKELSEAEARLADARLTADRAQRHYGAAEKRLRIAQAAEAESVKAAARVKRDDALETITKAGTAIDRLAAELAAQVAILDAQYPALNEAQRDGVAAVYTPAHGGTVAKLALDRAMVAQAGAWTGNKPTAADLTQRVAGAVMAGAT